MEKRFWITETNSYSVYATSKEEAKKKFDAYYAEMEITYGQNEHDVRFYDTEIEVGDE